MITRVLHVSKFPPGTPGGIERFVDQLVTAQRRQGIAAAVFACSDSRSGDPHPHRDYPVYTAHSHGQWLYLPVSPTYPFALARAIREFRPDVLHVQWPNPLALAALAVPAARRCRWVVHWQADIEVEGGPRTVAAIYRPFAWLERRLLRRAARVIATSRAYRDRSASLQTVRDRVDVIPLGLDFDAPHATPDPKDVAWVAGAALRVLCIARLVPYKGLDVLIDALRRVPEAAAVFIGEGPQGQALAMRAADLVATGRVRFVGRTSDAALEAWLASCDTLCLPSVNRLEAFGMTLLEAARAGKPAVATRVAGSGMTEVIEALGAGYLAEPGSVDSLAAALSSALVDKRAGRLHGPPRERLARFSIAAVAREIAALY